VGWLLRLVDPNCCSNFSARSFRFHNVCVLLGKLQPFGYYFQVRIIHFCHWRYGIYVAHVLLPSCGCPWMVERSTLCFPRQVAFLVLVVMLLGFSPGWDVPMVTGPANRGFTINEGKRASLFRQAWRLHTFVFSFLCVCIVSLLFEMSKVFKRFVCLSFVLSYLFIFILFGASWCVIRSTH